MRSDAEALNLGLDRFAGKVWRGIVEYDLPMNRRLWKERVINSILYIEERKRMIQRSSVDLEIKNWDSPGKDLRPRMISCLLFCREIRSSDIIKPNITREMNWLV